MSRTGYEMGGEIIYVPDHYTAGETLAGVPKLHRIIGGMFRKIMIETQGREGHEKILHKVRVALATPEGESVVEHAREIMDEVQAWRDEYGEPE